MVVWLALLLAAVPLVLRVSEAIAPGTGVFDTVDTESAKAQAVIDAQFPQSLPASSALVVVQAPDVTDEPTKNFLLNLEEELTAEGVLEDLESFSSIYTIQRTLLVETGRALGPAVYGLENATYQLNLLLFGVPETHVSIWTQTNLTAFIVYGIPSTYVAAWQATNESWTVPQRDQAANDTTVALLESIADEQGFNQTVRASIFGYYGLFFQSWAATAGNGTLVADPPLRAEVAIDATVPAFVMGIPDPLQAEFFSGVWQGLSLSTWNLTSAINAFASGAAHDLLAQGFGDPSLQAMLDAYYFLWLSHWNASFDQPETADLPPDERLSALLQGAILAFAGMQASDPETAGLIAASGLWFSRENATDPGAIHDFAVAQIVASSGGEVTAALLEAIYALGPAPPPGDLEALAQDLVEAGSLQAYPLPSSILREFVSEGNDTTIALIAFSEAPRGFGSVEGDPILENVVVIRDTIADLKSTLPYSGTTYVTGDAATTADAAVSGTQDFQRIEPITIAALIILIGLFFLSIVLPFVPLGSILVAFLLAQAVVFFIGTFIAKVQDTTLTFLFTIMLGVGTDYAIFLIARYREERVEGRQRAESVETAVTWAGESIATSGTTVIISFGVLSLGSFGLLRTMGVSIGLGVLIALLVSLTLVPALLMLLGERLFWPTTGKRFARYVERVRRRRARKRSYFYRAAAMSVDHHKAVLGVVVLISIPAIFVVLTGATSFDFVGGLTGAESVDGLQALQEGFGAGRIGPTQIAIVFEEAVLVDGNLTAESAGALEALSVAVAALPNVQAVHGPTRPLGEPVDATDMTGLSVEERAAALSAVGDDDRTVLVTATFQESPFTADSLDTVEAIREEVRTLQASDPLLGAAEVLVGGQSAFTLDFANLTNDEFRTMEIIVVVAIFVVLLVVLGSYLLPLAAVLSIGLSIVWAYGATLLFFRQVLQVEVLFLVPLILFILLFGIGMDYNIFILTRIREEAQKGKGTRQAVVDAVDRTGGIITALALILAAAVGSLMLSSNTLLQGFGFAIGFAVLADAMVVRTYVVPAIMGLLGNRAWRGPRMLQRVKPEAEGGPPEGREEQREG